MYRCMYILPRTRHIAVHSMSLAEKVAALRRFFCMPLSMELLPCIGAMNSLMGIVGDGSLPAQIDALVAASGVNAAAASGVNAAAAPTIASPVAKSPQPCEREQRVPTATSAGKRKATDQPTLFELWPKAQKTEITGDELRKQRVFALQGVDFNPKEGDMRTFASELKGSSSTAKQRVAIYACTKCPRIFSFFPLPWGCWFLSLESHGRHRFLNESWKKRGNIS